MPRRFTERERVIIRERLLDSGHRRFSTAGLRKTSIAEIAADAGLGKGSFYAFFESKEELFVAVAARHAKETSEALVASALSASASGASGLRALLRANARAMAAGNAHGVFSEEDALLARRKLTPETLARYDGASEHWMTPAAKTLQAQGLGRGLDPDVFAELLAIVVLAPLNHGVSPGDRFFAALDLLSDAVVDRLSSDWDRKVLPGRPGEET